MSHGRVGGLDGCELRIRASVQCSGKTSTSTMYPSGIQLTQSAHPNTPDTRSMISGSHWADISIADRGPWRIRWRSGAAGVRRQRPTSQPTGRLTDLMACPAMPCALAPPACVRALRRIVSQRRLGGEWQSNPGVQGGKEKKRKSKCMLQIHALDITRTRPGCHVSS